MDTIGSSVAHLGDIRKRYLTKAVIMFSGCGSSDKKKMSTGMGEIRQLNANEESMLELERKLGELENRIAISDENAMGRLTKEKRETG